MNWLFIGTLLGSVVTSPHDTEEACRGREYTLRGKGVIGQCVQAAGAGSVCEITTPGFIIIPNQMLLDGGRSGVTGLPLPIESYDGAPAWSLSGPTSGRIK